MVSLIGQTSLIVTVISLLLPESAALGACPIERSPADTAAPLTIHLGKDCTEQEREAHAVRASEIMSAFKAGRGVDLIGVAITGDLMLDTLPQLPAHALDIPSSRIQDRIRSHDLTRIRTISGPIAIRDSTVHGMLATNLREGLLLVKGPVTMTGTTFERVVDLSLATFLGPVDFSQTILLQQGFFIQTLFEKPARFEKTAFGIHSRFHKATFADTVTFRRAGFNGLAEFLQVSFEKDASFAQTYFKMGTGFSGSRFGGMLDFSEAVFDREAFFMFTVFEGDAYFRRATFRADADFSDAQFHGVDDFSKVFFYLEPRFTRTKVGAMRRSPGGLQDPRIQYGIAATLLIFTLLFIFFIRKK